MFSRFQVLMSGLQVLNKTYTTSNHVKKIVRGLPVKCRTKVMTIQEARELNTLSVESLVSNLQSHEMELNGDEPVKKFKIVALNFVGRYDKSSQTKAYKEAIHDEASDEESDDDEISFIIKIFQHLTKKKNIFSGKSGQLKGSSSGSDKDDQKSCFNCQKPDHYIVDCLDP